MLFGYHARQGEGMVEQSKVVNGVNHMELARLGAVTRLAEINAERREIFRAFPALKFRQVPATTTGSDTPVRRRPRKISAEGRKRMSEGMRRYWAKRKAAEAKASKH